MQSSYLAFGRGAPPVLAGLADVKLKNPVLVIGLISAILFGYWVFALKLFPPAANSIAAEPLGLISHSSSAPSHFMTTFAFGFLEFEWPPGQVPGFGPIPAPESPVKQKG